MTGSNTHSRIATSSIQIFSIMLAPLMVCTVVSFMRATATFALMNLPIQRI